MTDAPIENTETNPPSEQAPTDSGEQRPDTASSQPDPGVPDEANVVGPDPDAQPGQPGFVNDPANNDPGQQVQQQADAETAAQANLQSQSDNR